jgi:hypothetical protein
LLGTSERYERLEVPRSKYRIGKQLAASCDFVGTGAAGEQALFYDEKRPPTFAGRSAASKLSFSAIAETTIGA